MSVQLPSPRAPISDDIVRGRSPFATAIRELFARIRPRRVIETGTSVGLGTTRMICSALRDYCSTSAQFVSMEVNPQFVNAARLNSFAAGISVQMINALSVPRIMLPNRAEIAQALEAAENSDGLAFEPDEHDSADQYFAQTNFPAVADDGLGYALRQFRYKPDFVLLDSAPHVSFNEFNYLTSLLAGPCHVALPDIFHLKHAKSFQRVESDARFRIVSLSQQRLGFCIAFFDPDHNVRGA